MKTLRSYASIILLMLYATAAQADPSPAQQSPLVSPSPAFDAAVQNLSAGSFKQRQAAIKTLAQALADLSQQMLKDRAANSTAPLSKVLALHAGFSLWLQAAIAKPTPDPDYLTWGCQPDHLTLVARAYSTEPADRLDAAHQLAALDDPNARALLSTLLSDPDREVHLAAMDALWDATLTPDMVNAIWARANLDTLATPGQPNIVPTPPVNFHGHLIYSSMFGNSFANLHHLDADIAVDMLAHNHSPIVDQKIESLLNAIAAQPPAANIVGLQPLLAWGKINQLCTTQRSKNITAALLKIALADPGKPIDIQAAPGGAAARVLWDRRVAAIAGIVTMTGQDPASYRLFSRPNLFNNTPVVQNADDENFAFEKLNTWHKDQGANDLNPPTSDPSTPAKHIP